MFDFWISSNNNKLAENHITIICRNQTNTSQSDICILSKSNTNWNISMAFIASNHISNYFFLSIRLFFVWICMLWTEGKRANWINTIFEWENEIFTHLFHALLQICSFFSLSLFKITNDNMLWFAFDVSSLSIAKHMPCMCVYLWIRVSQYELTDQFHVHC